LETAHIASSYKPFDPAVQKGINKKDENHPYLNNFKDISYFVKRNKALNVIDSTIKKIARDVANTASDLKTLEFKLSSIENMSLVNSAYLLADLNVDINENSNRVTAEELKFKISTLLFSRSDMISKYVLNKLNLEGDNTFKGVKTATKSFYSDNYSVSLTLTA
jgi:hypothetical protein